MTSDHDGEPTSAAGGSKYRGQRARGTFEGRAGKPIGQFLRDHPKPMSSARRAIQQSAQDNGWEDRTNPALRKEEVYAKPHVKIGVDYSETGSPTRARLTNSKGALLATASSGVVKAVCAWLAADVSTMPA